VCNKFWNAIDAEALASGEPFIRTLRAMASEYGIPFSSGAYDPEVARQRALEREAKRATVYNWRAGFLNCADEILEQEKEKLFDPAHGAADEALILSLTAAARAVREAESERELIGILDDFARAMPELTEDLAQRGKLIRFRTQAALEEFIEQMAWEGSGPC
jgi:hypothetical protein